jgi:hypothetical protein
MEIPWIDMRPVAASQRLGLSTISLGGKTNSDRRSGRELPLKSTATKNYN